VRDDVTTFLRAALEAGQGWDFVILDPPKLAPNRSSLPRASHKYRRLNSLALGVVRSGGLLMTCSCSGAMTQSGGLAKVVADAAADAERQVRFL
jgi:23S rRNA G2069 N7-methylase RlmK/C1962 C5-methylase RlmI